MGDEAQHAFLDAAKRQDWAVVFTLLESTPALVDCQPAARWSALHQAAAAGDVSTVHALLFQHGAALDVRTRDGLLPADVAHADCKGLLEATRRHAGDAGDA